MKKNILSLDLATAKVQVVEAKKELFNLRFQKAQSPVTNSARIRLLRKNVARLKTFLNAQNLNKSEK